MMGILETLILVVHLIVAVVLCVLVLLQHGKGADMGAAFGSGSSGSVFGASGSANFLSRSTAVLAFVFFLSSLGLTYLGATRSQPVGDVMEQGVMKDLPPSINKDIPQPSTPAAPAAAPAPGGGAAPAGSGAAPAGGSGAAPAGGGAAPAGSGNVAPAVPAAPSAPSSKAGDVPR